MKMPILIRADASAAIGTGHVMRCLALAHASQRAGGITIFAQAETTPTLEQRLQSEGMEIARLAPVRGSAEDAAQTVELSRARGAMWVVADGYCFDSAWQKQIREAGLRLLLIDDYGQAEHYHADVVLNQNLSADASLYARRDSDTQLLLGPRYALLRREFWNVSGASRAVADIGRKVLVTMGGSDPDQVTGQVVAALQGLADIEAVVVAGGSNLHLEALTSIAATNPALRLVVNVTSMPELMAWADVAVSAAGSTAWELAYMGLPSLLIIAAENQTGIAEALARDGVSLNLGRSATLTADGIGEAVRELLANHSRRREQSEKGRRVVDGRGVERVLAAFGD